MIVKSPGSKPDTVLVTFQVPASVWAEMIHLVGDFNAWNPHSHPLSHTSGEGPWQVTVELQKGRVYQYRYIVDGTYWQTDWNGSPRIPNPFGSDNAIITT